MLKYGFTLFTLIALSSGLQAFAGAGVVKVQIPNEMNYWEKSGFVDM